MLTRLVDVRPGERGAVLGSFAYFFLLFCSWSILRPIRDEMAIAGGVNALPWMFTATFLAMLAAVPLFSALVARVPRARLIPIIYVFFLACLVAFFALLRGGVAPVVVARVFYVWTSVYNLFVVSVFWSFMADRFDSAQGRRLFGFIAAGGSAGGLVGPLATTLLVERLGATNLILVSAVLLAGCLPLIAWLARHGSPAQRVAAAPVGGGMLDGIVHIFRSRYLLGLVALVLLYTTTSTVLYTIQAHVVEAAISDRAARTRLFASMDTVANLATVLLQLVATGRFIARVGLRATLAVVPILTAVGFIALGVWPVLWVVVGFQVLRRVVHQAVDRPAREMLFTALSRDDKYKAKNFIDTVVYRGGDAGSVWLVAGLLGLNVPLAGVALAAVPFALLWLSVTRSLARGYASRVQPSNSESERETT